MTEHALASPCAAAVWRSAGRVGWRDVFAPAVGVNQAPNAPRALDAERA